MGPGPRKGTEGQKRFRRGTRPRRPRRPEKAQKRRGVGSPEEARKDSEEVVREPRGNPRPEEAQKRPAQQKRRKTGLEAKKMRLG